MKFNRIVTIVLDSVGIGAMPDAKKYNDDESVNTLKNISLKTGLELPNLQRLGLGNITELNTIKPETQHLACYSKMAEMGEGKDTMTGHWEMMGCTLTKGFKQYVENGFDEELISEFERLTGRSVIANKEASGMKVIKEYYQEHVDTGSFIVYTSVDSTFQIAAHEDVISLDELYKACEIARELTKNDKYNVARVIARPFLGGIDDFYRTANRHDYALDPFEKTVMQKLVEKDLSCYCIGKISDIFNGVGVSKKVLNKSNDHGIDNTINALKEDFSGFLFVNLVDFDSLYGHPRDVVGYSDCLKQFDDRLNEIIDNLLEDDLLIITADHGNDPTYKGNDHTREYVPLLVYSKSIKNNKKINDRATFEDIGQTICENFNLEDTKYGTSFLGELI